MSLIATALKHMMAAGMSPDAIVAAVTEMEASAPKADEQAERRRAKDRVRQAALRNLRNLRISADSAENAEPPPLPRPSSPQTPQQPTPIPPDITTRARGGCGKPNGFARFWEAYPNKVSKGRAEPAYAKALGKISGPDPPAEILAGVERAKASRQWREGFIPHPASWLNGCGWEDEPAEIIPITGPRHERPHHDAKFEARQANLAAHERGADLAARLRRES